MNRHYRDPDSDVVMNDLERRIVDSLDRQAEALDANTASRLNQARQRALAEGARTAGRTQIGPSTWLPLGALAGVALAAVAIALTLGKPGPAPDQPLAAPSDLELVASDDLELVADLEFYAWLEGELEERG